MSEPFDPLMSSLVGFVWSAPIPNVGVLNLCPQEHGGEDTLLIAQSDDLVIYLDRACLLFNDGHSVTIQELLRLWLDGHLDDRWLKGQG
jgi:hypothetical protein